MRPQVVSGPSADGQLDGGRPGGRPGTATSMPGMPSGAGEDGWNTFSVTSFSRSSACFCVVVIDGVPVPLSRKDSVSAQPRSFGALPSTVSTTFFAVALAELGFWPVTRLPSVTT